ncbi:acyl-CoA dehydrogenase [Variovorax sp. DXTD-1]|nr:acyl-CoA dehydrogenase [Variovorax sp. DXTD-1]
MRKSVCGVLEDLCEAHDSALALEHLTEAGIDRLALPAAGQTLARWRILAQVAAHDLSLAKLFEGHTDALAILAELGGPAALTGSRWGTWCAEPPDARVVMSRDGPHVRLVGTKAWCSGAAQVTHAIVSCWNGDGEPCLAAVQMNQPGVEVTGDGWLAVGMAASSSVDVRFDGAEAIQVGGPHDYVRRLGFWHGGAGIAACWLGGALGIANMARAHTGAAADPHRRAHVGAMDVALAGALAVLREAAAWIDAQPRDDARRVALRARLVVEQAAADVMHHAGRAVGAGPLCRDARFARAMADLPVFLRQSHAERDLAALGESVDDAKDDPWVL